MEQPKANKTRISNEPLPVWNVVTTLEREVARDYSNITLNRAMN